MKFNYPGLSDQAVAESRDTYGANVVTTQESENFLDKLLKNLKDPIIVILIVALGVTVLLAVLGFAPWYEGLVNGDWMALMVIYGGGIVATGLVFIGSSIDGD